MAAIFLLGWPLEWVPIVLIVLPIVLPLIIDSPISIKVFISLAIILVGTIIPQINKSS